MQNNTNQDVLLRFHENTGWRLVPNTAWGVFVLIILMTIVPLAGSVSSGAFWSAANVRNMTWIWIVMALLAPSMALIIASGGVDLSVGSVAGLTASVMALLVAQKVGVGGALVAGLSLGFLVGLVNGFLIGVIKLDAVIVTLAMMTMLRGACYVITEGKTIPSAGAGFLSLPAIPGVILILLIIVCVVASELGFAGNKKPGGKAGWVRQSLSMGLPYVLSSTVAGFVGALYLGRIRAATPTIGTGLEVDVILMVCLGGTPLGRGLVNIVGASLAALALAMMQSISALTGITPFALTIGKGAALLMFGLLCHAYYYVVNLVFTNTRKAVSKEPGIDV